MGSRSFEDLEVWQKSCRLCEDVCRVPMTSPPPAWAFRDQMMRSALSIPSNIAEGSERDSIPDFGRFLRIAKGSSAELRTQLHLASRLDIIPAESAKDFTSRAKSISAMLQALLNSLNSKS